MSSACTCHINPEQCWWCLYEVEKAKVQRYERALKVIAYQPDVIYQHGWQDVAKDALERKG